MSYDSTSSVDDPRDFKLIKYPNIHFGYAAPNAPFIARQNWWQLFLHPQTKDAALTGIGDTALDSSEYVLSLYEVPAQLAISSSAFTNLGQIGGSAWNTTDVQIEGRVYAKKANVEANSFEGVATTDGATISSGVSVGNGSNIVTGGSLAAKETFEAEKNTFYPISKASDYARSLFMPINAGIEFFDRYATDDTAYNAGSRYSRESWNNYSRGCHQCVMRLDVIATAGGANANVSQTPTVLRFSYQASNNTTATLVITNNPEEDGEILWEQDNREFPFQQESIDGRDSVTLHIDRLVTWLRLQDPAIDFTVNNSMSINVDYTNATVVKPSFPAAATDAIVVLRGCDNLTAFPLGFSVVTNLRLHIMEDYNQNVYVGGNRDGLIPATSLFAPEIRYGNGNANRVVDIEGSMGNLNTSSVDGINILDLKGTGDSLSGTIKAKLKPIDSLDELPPINVMNWLVVVQKK